MNRTNMRLRFTSCPVCKEEIQMDVAVDLEATGAIVDAGTVEGGTLPLSGKVLGLKVDHDCRPKETRDQFINKMFPGAVPLAEMTTERR